ncbi:MAG: acyl-CoA-binding protein [Myxococcales bacterium]|nr:acyl-CoA-binding protein [Myxococcales bacterium]MCB9750582.1 acyl-CoA-binding protein [Myxococcales bacterium]
MSLDQRFEDAVTRSRSLPSQSNENLLMLYALYKQATLGDASGPPPGRFDVRGRRKFDAWADFEGTPPDEAKAEYIALVDRLGAS